MLRKLLKRASPKELPASFRNKGSFRQDTGLLFFGRRQLGAERLPNCRSRLASSARENENEPQSAHLGLLLRRCYECVF